MKKIKNPTTWACYSRREARNQFQKRFNGKLRPDIVVHHKDQDPFNNDSSNLELMFRSQHSKMHADVQRNEYLKMVYGNKTEDLFEKLEKELRKPYEYMDRMAPPPKESETKEERV